MGQTGISDLFRINTSLINPSVATTISEVYFSTGVFYHNNKYTLKNETKKDDNYSFPYLSIIVPINENHKLGINFFSNSNGLYEYEEKSITIDSSVYQKIGKLQSRIDICLEKSYSQFWTWLSL